MKIYSADQYRIWDRETIRIQNISSLDLMERASERFCHWFCEKFSPEHPIHIFCGPGNNGGDGLAIARLLLSKKRKVACWLLPAEKYSEDNRSNQYRLEALTPIHKIKSAEGFPILTKGDIVIDALLGYGIHKAAEGLLADLIHHLNASTACRVSVDIPSGMHPDKVLKSATIQADHCLSFQRPKLAFLLPETAPFCGKWELADIGLEPTAESKLTANFHWFNDLEAASIIKRRNTFSHKGSNGHLLVIAGSADKYGAALLSSKAALVAGAGLVSLFSSSGIRQHLFSYCPELMLAGCSGESVMEEFPDTNPYSAVVVGPGIGTNSTIAQAFLNALGKQNKPLVLDADALNILATHPEAWPLLPHSSILTPHPKEFERLFGNTANDFEKLELQRQKSIQFGIHILRKGAYSFMTDPLGNSWFNSSGNPSLATAGSGDVLSGIIGSLMAQKYEAFDALRLAVFLHGYAADLQQQQQASGRMMASDIFSFLPAAFAHILGKKERAFNP